MESADQFVGPYHVAGILGQGGMGVVYDATHVATGERVALKTVRVPDPTILSSMRREIFELERLSHPGVVRVVDQGLHDGLPWYAMEFIDGVSLRAYARAGKERYTREYTTDDGDTPSMTNATAPFGDGTPNAPIVEPELGSQPLRQPVQRTLIIIARLCSALAYIHGEGIVHRDLKPENVLVLEGDRPVLVDFGIATSFGGGVGRDILEVEGGIAGTFAYMAPEQTRGELLDARADLYSLGCVLYELITGRPPFIGPGTDGIVLAHQLTVPVAPSALVPDTPPELDQLVLSLLEKQPADRLGYADDVAARLSAISGVPLDAHTLPRPYLYRAEFTGRREGFEALTRRWIPNWERPPNVVLVGGESGIGKTRLLREVARHAAQSGIRVLSGECSPSIAGDTGELAEGSVALEPLRPALQAIADRCRERGREETHRLLGPRGPVLAAYEPRLWQLEGLDDFAEPAELSPDASMLRVYSALFETLAEVAKERPLLLVLDDLQWADELTLGFLEHVLDRGSRAPHAFGIYGVYRAEETGESVERLIESDGVIRIELGRLAKEDVASIVGDMLALDPPPERLAKHLNRYSEGNPFFVAEFLRAAVEDGVLARDRNGRWGVSGPGGIRGVSGDLDQIQLPRSLRDLISRRLDGLSDDARATVDAAAVLGRETSVDVIASTSGLDVDDVIAAVGELIRRHVFVEGRSGRVRFAHDRIREVAYKELVPIRRARLHLMAAASIARGANLEEVQGILGLHWERAGEIEQARNHYLAGARAAVRRFALREAERLYRAYLDLPGEESSERIIVMNELGHAVLRAMGRQVDALALQQEALSMSMTLDDRAGEARSRRMAGVVMKETGDLQRAESELQKALELVVEDGDRKSEGMVRGYLAGLFYERGELVKSLGLYTEALELARRNADLRAEGMSLSNIAILNVEMGRWDIARASYEQAIAIQARVGDRNALVATLTNFAYLQLEEGQFAAARENYERALSIAREIGRRRFQGIVLANMADLALSEGDIERAVALCVESLAIHREVENRRWEGITLEALAIARGAARLLDEAISLVNEALAIHVAIGNRSYEGSSLIVRAGLERRLGKLDEADATLASARPIVDEIGDPRAKVRWLVESGYLAIARNESVKGVLDEIWKTAAQLGVRAVSRPGREVAALERAAMRSGLA